MAVVYIAVITESDYSAFREVCKGRDFPAEYRAYLKRVERRKKGYRARGFVARGVNIDFAGFKRRRWPSGGATYRDLDRYAARLVDRKQK